ncbi:hypothetical protein ACN47E_010277 [Coniothyrium glycines]
MPPRDEHLLERLLKKYESHMIYHESVQSESFSLTNEILPMFQDRWVHCRDHDIRQFYHRVKPALQLASRLLTEDYCLQWFSQLTFGERRRKSYYSDDTYIVPTAYASSAQAVQQVRTNLDALYSTITLMISPRGTEEQAWGVTYLDRSMMPFSPEYLDMDFPPLDPRSGHARPLIAMNRVFQEFFLFATDVSFQEHTRALFMFASTLVHEIAHAYNFWLGHEDEPLWDIREQQAELGFSWETNVLGRVMNPLTSSARGPSSFRALCAVTIRSFCTPGEHVDYLQELKSSHRTAFTTLDRHGRSREYPLLHTGDVRGGRLLSSNDTTRNIAVIQHIPCQWLVNWFQDAWWFRMKTAWSRERAYFPPPLGEAFMLIYENNIHSARIHRPLNPAHPVDAEILYELQATHYR